MPIPNHQSFAEICIAQGVEYQQWQKTAETDRIVNLLYDQIDGRSSALTTTERALALINYISIKSMMGNTLYANAPAVVRTATNDLTYNNTLVTQNQGQFGLCGRFSRVLQTVTNEITYTGTPATQGEIFQLWCGALIDNVLEGLNISIPPTPADTSLYQINGGDVVENDGSTITLSAGDDLVLATGAVGFTSNDWKLDGGSLGSSGHTYTVTGATIGNAGTYVNVYTNSSGSSDSDTFTVTVT